MDEVFGLIETAEKAAEVYTYVCAQGGINQTISDENLRLLADSFGVTPREGLSKQLNESEGQPSNLLSDIVKINTLDGGKQMTVNRMILNETSYFWQRCD